MIAVIPSAGPNRAKSGKVDRSISPGSICVQSRDRIHLGAEDRVGVDRPLGTPVLPLVKRIAAGSSASVLR